jgi:hypothetical protein
MDVKLARRRSVRVRMESQISIWFIPDACFGVEWKTIRGVGSFKKVARVAWERRTPDVPLTPRSSVSPDT